MRVVAESRAADKMKKGKAGSKLKSKDANGDLTELKAPEDGISDALRDVSKYLGGAIANSRIADAFVETKAFPIDENTRPLDIIRYCFRMITIALPWIREISLWGFDLSGEAAPTLVLEETTKRTTGLMAFFTKEVKEEEQEAKPFLVNGFFGIEDPCGILSTPTEKRIIIPEDATNKADVERFRCFVDIGNFLIA